jgi:hypothetical protein
MFLISLDLIIDGLNELPRHYNIYSLKTFFHG